ncbi:MAG: Ig-like domain-containing protein, partial [Mobilitalea sp.]
MYKKRNRHGIAILLILAMVLGLFPETVHPVKAASITSPTANGADGSEVCPYIIDELDDLLWIADQVNNQNNAFSGKYFMQTADINLTGQSWTPIGISSTPGFGGNYDGNGHAISNVSCSSAVDSVGFFGNTNSGSTIKNLTISSITVENTANNINSKNIGAMVGFNYSSISNCHITGVSSVTANVDGSMSIGGFVGWSATAVSKCSSNATISTNNYVASMGGIVGSQSANINDCVYSGTLNNSAVSPQNNIGGIAGWINGTIKHCYVNGSLISTATNTGGIAGYYSNGSTNSSTSDNNYYLSGIAAHGYASFGSVADDTGTIAKTETEFKSASNYSGWDFTSVWKNDTEGTTYPYLRMVGTISSSSIDASNPSSILVSGNLSSDGGDTITVRGAEYCAYGNTAYTQIAAVSGGVGNFNVNLTGLPEGIYYVRPYATNQVGTVHGNLIKISFTPTGSGTSSDPYVVDSDEDLNFIRYAPDAYYSLDYDLDLSSSAFHNWTPIGNENHPFTGEFDGNGHVISGYVAGSLTGSGTTTYSGLFGIVDYGGTVKYLGVSGTVSAASYSGGIAAINSGTIFECFNSADITVTYSSASIGGIAGSNYGLIENCYNTGNISANGILSTDYPNAGGIAGADGDESGVTISKCYNTGNISGGTNIYAAGILGCASYSMISNCFNTGSISTTGSSGEEMIGGIAAQYIVGSKSPTLTNCDFLAQTGLMIDGVTVGDGEASANYFTVSTNGTSYDNFHTTPGWDFTNIWEFIVGSYPTLKAFTPVVSSVISTSAGLTEQNLNGSNLTVTLNYTTFNAVLDKLAFTLSGMPAGTSISSVTRTSDKICTVELVYDNTDFDDNKNITLTIGATQLASGAELTSNTLSITATDEPAPTVLGIAPNSGLAAGGTSVTITGTDFTGASAVYFGGTAADSFIVDSSTSITAMSPAGAGTVDITVVTKGGTSMTNAADSFLYLAVPKVTGITPVNGPLAGASVVITGTGLNGTTAVKFNTISASFVVNSDTQITATAPAGTAGTVDIIVTAPGGTSTTSVNNQFTYIAPPSVSITSTTANPTRISTIPVTITFSENVTGFTMGDISVTGGTIANFTGSGTTYSAEITPSGEGLVIADISAGVAQDTVGNANTAAAQFSRTYDSITPTASITSIVGSPTNSSPIPVTITFSESVTGFTLGDITVVGGTLISLSGSGTTYSAEIDPLGNGIVTVDIADGVAQDAAGNNNTSANQLLVSYNGNALTVLITSTASSFTTTSLIPVTITFSANVTGFTEGNIVVSGGTLGNFSGSGAIYTATITPSGQGTVTADIAAGAAQDVIGKNSEAAATLTVNVTDATPPSISPDEKNYDLNSPSDVSAVITWNNALSVIDVVYGSDHLTSPSVYTVTGSALTINSSFIAAQNLSVGDTAKFDITFNTGATASLIVHIVNGYVPSSEATLSDLTVAGSTISGFVTNTDTYNVELPYGTSPGNAAVMVGAISSDSHASLQILQVASLPGDAIIEVTAENAIATKIYTIHFTLGVQPYTPSTPVTPSQQNQEPDNSVPTEVGSNTQGWSAITDSIAQLITE